MFRGDGDTTDASGGTKRQGQNPSDSQSPSEDKNDSRSQSVVEQRSLFVPPHEVTESVAAAIALFEDQGLHGSLELAGSHALLSAAGVPEGDLRARLVWVAARWQALAEAAGHAAGCQCHQCRASRRLLAAQ